MKVNFEYNKSSGQIAKMLLAGLIVIIIAIAIAYFVIKSAEKPTRPTPSTEVTVPVATYEITKNDIKFTFQDAQNMGSILKGALSKSPSYQKDKVSTENFIKVTIGAQNKGKENTPDNSWDIGNIIDSDGRIFIPFSYDINPWLPEPNLCGDILKPEFAPTSCTKIYEVARISKDLKIEVISSKKGTDGKYDSSKKETTLLDLIVNPVPVIK